MLPNVGWSELLVIMVLALVVFGPQRLPGIARQIGRAIAEVRRVSGQFQDEVRAGLALDEDFPYMSGPGRREAPGGRAEHSPKEAELPEASEPDPPA